MTKITTTWNIKLFTFLSDTMPCSCLSLSKFKVGWIFWNVSQLNLCSSGFKHFHACISQEDPDNLMYLLNALGVDCYRGATQLNIVEPLNGSPNPLMAPQADHRDHLETDINGRDSQNVHTVNSSTDHVPTVNRQYPHETKYLVDHVLYLPINKLVPFHALNRMLKAIHTAVALDKMPGDERVKVELRSKL